MLMSSKKRKIDRRKDPPRDDTQKNEKRRLQLKLVLAGQGLWQYPHSAFPYSHPPVIDPLMNAFIVECCVTNA